MATKLEQIKELLTEAGWELVSTTYANLDTEMEYKCSEGHTVFAPWRRMRLGFECPACNAAKMRNPRKAAPRPRTSGERRVLAIDQATHTSGWAVYADEVLLDCGIYVGKGGNDIQRIANIKEWFLSMLELWQPDMVAIEGVHLNKGAVTVLVTLARLQGVLLVTCHEMGLPAVVCDIGKWRSVCGVTGKTRADQKRSMRLRVKQWFGKDVSDDVADAIGIGRYASQFAKSQPQ